MLTGMIPGWIFTLPSLNYLNFYGNLFTGIGEFDIGNGSSLIWFNAESNMLTGMIPGWIFTLPSLNYLDFNQNLFTGIDEFDIANGSSLIWFSARNNQLRGKIPYNIFYLHNLQTLDLSSNNLSGTIPFSRIHKLKKLKSLSLSNNSLSIIDDMGVESTTSWPNFEALSLSSCNLTHFPNFLRGQMNLRGLELSNNGIHGRVPHWVLNISIVTLNILDLSHNSLTGGLEHLPWKSMEIISIEHNFLQGVVLVPSSTTTDFLASNNQFTGEIPPAFCECSALELLDLSHNALSGNLLNYFQSLISLQLEVLDLSQNQLQGVVPSSLFQNCSNLFTLNLSGNKLEGPIPQSLSYCLHMQLLDLSNNKLIDTFPHFLGVLRALHILILRSNHLHGSLTGSNTTNSFPALRILDISDNDLIGILPRNLLINMKQMVEINSSDYSPYMDEKHYLYEDSITAWVKGFTRKLDAILNKMVSIDVSRNMLEGPIPDAIGDLVLLRSLNLAHNNFTSHIPSSLSKLTLLESLDMSFNRLDGGIPSELVNLNSLELFNVSENDLVGSVPTGKQFNTFLDASYLGNPDFCGPYLTNKCGKPNTAPNTPEVEGTSDESSGLSVWEIGLMGCGCGMLVGLAWGYLIFWKMTP